VTRELFHFEDSKFPYFGDNDYVFDRDYVFVLKGDFCSQENESY
jgi:hypothetical protein